MSIVDIRERQKIGSITKPPNSFIYEPIKKMRFVDCAWEYN